VNKEIGEMIDKLFGSKTRVKLLHLFMNHPGQPFYVREITRLIDEQIITSDSGDNKLYYQANQRYEFYKPLRAIFAGESMGAEETTPEQKATVNQNEVDIITAIPSLRLAIFAGVLVKGSTSTVDVILVGNVSTAKVKAAISMIEKLEARELNYTVLPYDEFYYRLSVRDKFITEVLASKHSVAFYKDNILNEK
jgi:hypothetical protein